MRSVFAGCMHWGEAVGRRAIESFSNHLATDPGSGDVAQDPCECFCQVLSIAHRSRHTSRSIKKVVEDIESQLDIAGLSTKRLHDLIGAERGRSKH